MNNMKQYSLLGLGVALLGSYLLTSAPVQAQADDFATAETHNTRFKEVDVTEYSAFMVSEDGKKLFGTGKGGMNGVSATDLTVTSLVNIPLASNETIIDIDAGPSNVLVATSLGKVYAFGLTLLPYLPTGSATPLDITSSVNPTAKSINYVRQGTDVSFIIFTDSTISGWGSNQFGQLGDGSQLNSTIRNVTPVTTAYRQAIAIIDFDVRFRSGYALLANGTVFTWGYNANGQLGLGNTTSISAPLRVTTLTNVYSMSMGFDHAIALTNIGANFSIFGFGSNLKRQLTNHIPATAINNQPVNLTTYFTSTRIEDNEGDAYDWSILGDLFNNAEIDSRYARPKLVLASNLTSYIIVDYIDTENSLSNPYWTDIIGFGSNELGQIEYNEEETTIMGYPEYLDYDYYYDDHFVRSFANNGGFSGTVNLDGDYLLQGINLNNRLGIADPDENEVTNYSDNVRYFQEYDYPNLPTSFEAPLDYDALTYDQEYAIQSIIEIYFTEGYFTDKEQALLTQPQLQRMREIFAEMFEDEIVYGLYATDASLLSELEGSDPEDRYWYRSDLEYYVEYFSFAISYFIEDDTYLDDEIKALLAPSVETRLDEFRTILANVNEFEQDHLQTLLDAIKVYDPTSGYDYFYIDEDNREWLDLYDLSVGELIEAGLGDDILAVFEAYEALSEIEQMLLTEYYYWNYDELYYGYYEYFITAYEYELDAIATIEDNNYFELFDMLADIETLLADVDDLNDISFDLFTTFNEDGEYYEYESYEYWIYLSELLPYLQEAKPVFDDWQAIELALDYDEFEDIVLDREAALAILAMYEDYSDLSEDAQDTLDDERINYLYELALSFLIFEVEDALFEVMDIEDEFGYDGLFDNLDDVEAALALYDDLPVNLLDSLDIEAVEYYEYLLDLQAALTEALPVYGMIQELPQDIEDLGESDFEDILAAVNAYNDLSEDAQALLDGELLMALLEEVASRAIDNLPVEEALTLEDEDAVVRAREAYDLLTEDQQEALGEDYLLRLQAAEARIAALKQTAWGDILTTFGVLLLHVAAAAYFVFLKRKDLAKLTGIKILAK